MRTRFCKKALIDRKNTALRKHFNTEVEKNHDLKSDFLFQSDFLDILN